MKNAGRILLSMGKYEAHEGDAFFLVEANGYWLLHFHDGEVDEYIVEGPEKMGSLEEYVKGKTPHRRGTEHQFFLHYPGEGGYRPTYQDLSTLILLFGKNSSADAFEEVVRRLRFVGEFFAEKGADPDAAEQHSNRPCPGYEAGDELDLLDWWNTCEER